MTTLNFTENNNLKELTEGTTLLYFWAPWCGPCKMLSPILEEISEEFKHIPIIKVNVDENTKTAESYGLMSVPAIFLLENGTVKKNLLGYAPKEKILELITD